MSKTKNQIQALPKNIKYNNFLNEGQLTEIYQRLLDKPNVWCCFVGKKEIEEEKQRGTAIICGVEDKIEEKDLSPKERIPKRIECRSRVINSPGIRTDVVRLDRILIHQRDKSYYGPGDGITRLKDGGKATLGIALNHPEYGPVITTAGHLFANCPSDAREKVQLFSGNMRTESTKIKHVYQTDADYALIKIRDSQFQQTENLFRDFYRVGPFSFLGWQDVGKSAYILIRDPEASTDIIEVTIEGVNAHCNMGNGITHSNLILTTAATKPGYSGCCLASDRMGAAGLLVGALGKDGRAYSAFLPAHVPATREFSSLI